MKSRRAFGDAADQLIGISNIQVYMTRPPLPSTAAELTVELLNRHLALAANWQHGPFESIGIEPFGGMDSMSAAVFKIDGVLDSAGSISLIAKLRDVGGAASAFEGCRHEILCSRELAKVAGVESPETYVAELDVSTCRLLLVQEHLDDRTVGNIKTSLDISDINRITKALAGMHARWWNSDCLSRLTAVRTFEDAFANGARQFESGVYSGKRFLERYGKHVHPEVARMYGSNQSWSSTIQNGFSNNRTLCHYDVAAKNLSLPKDPSRAPIFFDWSLVIRGSIGVELGQIVALSLDVDEHDHIPEILANYLESMNRLGVDDLTYGSLWNDVRYGLLTRLAAPIALASRDYVPAHDLALEILPRITSAVLASDALELLE